MSFLTLISYSQGGRGEIRFKDSSSIRSAKLGIRWRTKLCTPVLVLTITPMLLGKVLAGRDKWQEALTQLDAATRAIRQKRRSREDVAGARTKINKDISPS